MLLTNELHYAVPLVDNGTIEIKKCREIEKDKFAYVAKYDHKKFVENLKYEVEEEYYSFTGWEENITKITIGSTYAKSVLDFIRHNDIIYLGKKENNHFDYNFIDKSFDDPYHKSNQITRFYKPEDTDGFNFYLKMINYFPDGKHSNICTSRTINDGEFIIMENESTPFAWNSEQFFKYYELIDDEIVIPNLTFNISCINFNQFKKIYDVLSSTNEHFNWVVPETSLDQYLAAKNKYEREQENRHE